MQGEVGDWEGLEGSQVEYTTRRKGKKLEAVTLKLQAREVRAASKVKQVIEEGARSLERNQELEAGMESLDLSCLQGAASAPQHLHLTAARLERENLLLSPQYTTVVLDLLKTKNVRVCCIVFNNISGRLSLDQVGAPGQSWPGRGPVPVAAWHDPAGGALGRGAVLRRSSGRTSAGCASHDEALKQEGHGVIEATVSFAAQEQLIKVRDLLELWGSKLEGSPCGVMWIREVNMKIAMNIREGGDLRD